MASTGGRAMTTVQCDVLTSSAARSTAWRSCRPISPAGARSSTIQRGLCWRRKSCSSSRRLSTCTPPTTQLKGITITPRTTVIDWPSMSRLPDSGRSTRAINQVSSRIPARLAPASTAMAAGSKSQVWALCNSRKTPKASTPPVMKAICQSRERRASTKPAPAGMTGNSTHSARPRAPRASGAKASRPAEMANVVKVSRAGLRLT